MEACMLTLSHHDGLIGHSVLPRPIRAISAAAPLVIDLAQVVCPESSQLRWLLHLRSTAPTKPILRHVTPRVLVQLRLMRCDQLFIID